MKTKYQTMSNQEKKDLKKAYRNTTQGKLVLKKLNSSLIMIILSFICSIYLVVDTYLNKRNTFYYFYAGALIVFALIFIIIYFKTRQRILNNYALKKQNKK